MVYHIFQYDIEGVWYRAMRSLMPLWTGWSGDCPLA